VRRKSPGSKPDASRTGNIKKPRISRKKKRKFTEREVTGAGAGRKGVFRDNVCQVP
jgi:hypothetical protein